MMIILALSKRMWFSNNRRNWRFHAQAFSVFVVSETGRARLPRVDYDYNNKRGFDKAICYQEDIDFSDLFQRMKQEYGTDRITIQSGGMLNTALVRNGLIDYHLVVIASVLWDYNTSIFDPIFYYL